jgi:hypothetical protein
MNLDRIAFDPHFQRYWIPRNVTWIRQFRAAAFDLYLEPAWFRNVGSLSKTFARLQSERVVERILGTNLRQTVTYVWGVP